MEFLNAFEIKNYNFLYFGVSLYKYYLPAINLKSKEQKYFTITSRKLN